MLLSEICILKNGNVLTIPLHDPSARGYSFLAFSKQSTALFFLL